MTPERAALVAELEGLGRICALRVAAAENESDTGRVIAWRKHGDTVTAAIAALRADAEALAQMEQELGGDGSHNPDPRVALGLRACFELQAESIALLQGQLKAAEARVKELEAALPEHQPRGLHGI